MSRKAIILVLVTLALLTSGAHTGIKPFNAKAADTDAITADDTPTVPDIKVSYIVQDGTKVSVQFDSTLNPDEYFTGMTVFRKESEEIGYVLYSDIDFDNETSDFSYVYDFWDNGEYRVTLYSIGHPEWYSDFTIDSIGTGVVTEDKFVDDKDPVITLDVPDTTGLHNGDEFKFKVYTDEPCTIMIGMDTYADTSEVEYTAYFNSDFNIVATDSWANSSVATVSVRAFEDGKLPSGNSLDKNENPLNKDNKDTFYKDVADGRFKNVSNTSNKGSSNSVDELPQTGMMDKLADVLKILIPLLVSGIGVFFMRRNKSAKEGSINE